MQKIQHIIKNPKYLAHIEAISKHEKTRKFCKHDLSHYLAVARIAVILQLESSEEHFKKIDKQVVYAAALLHDIGRWLQYEDNTPHNETSASFALQILQEAGFSKEEIAAITQAILKHSEIKSQNQSGLVGLLYRADKLSRECFLCAEKDECHWDKKNEVLFI